MIKIFRLVLSKKTKEQPKMKISIRKMETKYNVKKRILFFYIFDSYLFKWIQIIFLYLLLKAIVQLFIIYKRNLNVARLDNSIRLYDSFLPFRDQIEN